jgi:hypothetical protein
MKVICTNNKEKPLEITDENWLEERKEYTVKQIFQCPNGLGCTLEEIQTNNEKYGMYGLHRFSVNLEEIMKRIKIFSTISLDL